MKNHSTRYLLIPILLAAIFGLAAILTTDSLQSANDRSRWATVWSLAERDTWKIDEIITQPGWDTIDKVRHEDHFYSSKPPLLPWLVSIVYRIVKGTTGWNLLDNTQSVTRTILLFVNLIPMLVAMLLLGLLVERHAKSRFTLVFLLITFGFGTFLTTFQTVLNNHLPAAVCLTIAIYAIVKIKVEKSSSAWWYFLVGLFAALLCTNEIPAAPFGILAFLWLLKENVKKTLLFFVPAALVPLGAFFWLNYDCTGGLRPFYAFYGTEKYRYIYKGIPSYWKNPSGIDANEESPWSYFFNCTVGHHGIYSLTPVFLLSLVGWFGVRKKTEFPLRFLLWTGLGLTILLLGFYLSRTQNYNYGGKTVGLRWTFWLIPFWLISMIPVLDSFSQSRKKSSVACLLLLGSLITSVSSVWHPWEHPWIYRLAERQGWVFHSSGKTLPFDPPMTTWFRTLPNSTDEKKSWIRFEGVDDDGEPLTVELRDQGTHNFEGRIIQTIELLQTNQNEKSRRTFEIDREAFRRGESPVNFLVSQQSQNKEDLLQLAGLPGLKRYRPGRVRYLFTKLREDAFTCRHVRETTTAKDFQKKLWNYRCDIWVCEDVPFGILKVVWTKRDHKTNRIVSRKIIQAVDCFPKPD